METNALIDKMLHSDYFLSLVVKGEELSILGSSHLTEDDILALLYQAFTGISGGAQIKPAEGSQVH